MPSSREMAQRYAAASRKKKRRDGGPRVVIRPRTDEIEETADDEAEIVEEPSDIAAPRTREAAGGPRVVRARASARRVVSEYAQDYTYVAGDLRHIALVFGGLLVVLVALTFVLH